jgi:hypothetical protein
MIESKSIGCSIAAMLLLLSPAPAASAQGVTFPNELTLLDESANIAWAGECGQIPLIGDRDSPGQRPLSKFATNRDGDIVGWRLNATSPSPGQLDPTSIPMLWIRSTPTSDTWTPVRLWAGAAATPAAATGVIRVRECEDGPATGIFVSGWRQVAREPMGSVLPARRYEAMLWYIPMANGIVGVPEIVPIAPNHCDDEAGFPENFLAGRNAGDAWATEAIEVLYRDSCASPGQGPQIVMHATQAYRCVCDGEISEPITAYAPMRIEFDVRAWLAARATSSDKCDCANCGFPAFRWRLTDGYPAIKKRNEWLLASREARSTVHLDHRLLATTRTGLLDRRNALCPGSTPPGTPTQCFPGTYDASVVGPVFGSLVFTGSGTQSPLPPDRYLLGSTEEPNSERIFPGALSTPRIHILNPRGMALTPDGRSCPIDMPFQSTQYESAAKGRGSTFEQITAGWRRYSEDLAANPLSPTIRPLAWFPMELRSQAPGICGQRPPDCPTCNPIVLQGPSSPAAEIRGRAIEMPRLVAEGGQYEIKAWALGCEFVGRSSACSKPQLVGGGSKGARIWYQEGNVWKVQQLPNCDSLTEAHSIMPDGAVVVVGQADCGMRGHPFQPIRVLLPPRLGDLNGDGAVNAADMTILLNSFGTNDPCSPADLDGDGVVGAPDLAILLNNWG